MNTFWESMLFSLKILNLKYRLVFTIPVLVSSQFHRSICKAIVRGGESEKTIVENLCSVHLQLVTNRMAKIIKEESNNICKRRSGSFCRKKRFRISLNSSGNIWKWNWRGKLFLIRYHAQIDNMMLIHVPLPPLSYFIVFIIISF